MCKFCEGSEVLEGRYSLICVSNNVPKYGVALTVTFDKCPKFANCSAKELNPTTHFAINYCPVCGKKLK